MLTKVRKTLNKYALFNEKGNTGHIGRRTLNYV